MFLSSHLTRVLLGPTKSLTLLNSKHFSHTIPNTKTTPLNLKPLNAKISSFMRNGLTQEAHNLFDKMPQRNTVTWNAMVRGYIQNGHLDKAIHLFRAMPVRDTVSFNTMISGLMQCGNVDGAREVFERMPSKDVVSWNSMVSGFVNNGLVDEAVRMFEGMRVKDVVSWNTVIGGLVSCGDVSLAEEYFRRMDFRDVVSWTIMISGFAGVGRVREACEIFGSMPVRDVRAWNAMMVGYVENGDVEAAEALFWDMPERNCESWNELIMGLISNGRVVTAMRFFMEMPQKSVKIWNSVILGFIRRGLIREAHAYLEKKPYTNVVSWTNLIVGYFDVADVHTALKIFELVDARDTAVWNATIYGLRENDYGEGGLNLFIRMRREGESPDKATYTTVLTICSDLPALSLGKQYHAQITKDGFDKCTPVLNAVVTMYARCGNMPSALLVFTSMDCWDVISWNSIICGFAHHGNAERALKLFEQMRLTNVLPNHITFIGVLSACSHAGLIDQGKYHFDFMKNKCSIAPTSEHYTCIVDMLGRYGRIDEALGFIDQMKVDEKEIPTSVWGALLGACRIHKNIEVGEIAGKMILDVEPQNSGVYLILAEMYLIHGRKEDAKNILVKMKEKGVKKQPGCSWIEGNSSGQVFLAADNSHPQFGKIYSILESLHQEIEEEISRMCYASLED